MNFFLILILPFDIKLIKNFIIFFSLFSMVLSSSHDMSHEFSWLTLFIFLSSFLIE
jgi:hypothetical protein